eukprot:6385353-Amphidinium_carterae.2
MHCREGHPVDDDVDEGGCTAPRGPFDHDEVQGIPAQCRLGLTLQVRAACTARRKCASVDCLCLYLLTHKHVLNPSAPLKPREAP